MDTFLIPLLSWLTQLTCSLMSLASVLASLPSDTVSENQTKNTHTVTIDLKYWVPWLASLLSGFWFYGSLARHSAVCIQSFTWAAIRWNQRLWLPPQSSVSAVTLSTLLPWVSVYAVEAAVEVPLTTSTKTNPHQPSDLMLWLRASARVPCLQWLRRMTKQTRI